MVSKKTIEEYEFKTMEDYFNYISDSIINGQRQQARSLIKDLSKAQRKEAYNFFNDDYSSFFGEAKQLVIEAMTE